MAGPEFEGQLVVASGVLVSGQVPGAAQILLDSTDQSGSAEGRIQFFRDGEKGRIVIDSEDFLKLLAGTTEVAAIRSDRFEISQDLIADQTATRDIGTTDNFIRDFYVRRLQSDTLQNSTIFSDGSIVPETASVSDLGSIAKPWASGTFDILKVTTMSVGTFQDAFDVIASASGDFTDLTADSFLGIRNADGYAPSSTDGIQEAINALPPSGGVVVLQAHPYQIQEQVVLAGSDGSVRDNVYLIGKGPATTILRIHDDTTSNFTPINAQTGTDHGLISFTVDGNKGNLPTGGFALLPAIDAGISQRLLINDVHVHDMWGDGIEIWGAINLSMSRVLTFNNEQHGISHKFFAPLARVRASGVAFDQVISYTNSGYGFDFEPSPANSTMELCEAYSNAQHGIYLAPEINDGPVNAVTFVQTITHNNGTTDGDWHGFAIETTQLNTTFKELSFSRCTAFEEKLDGFFIRGATTTGTNTGHIDALNIDECFSFDNGRHGFWIWGDIRSAQVSNCQAYNNGTASGNSRGFKIGADTTIQDKVTQGVILNNVAAFDNSASTQDIGVSFEQRTRECIVGTMTAYGNSVSDFQDLGSKNRKGMLVLRTIGTVGDTDHPVTPSQAGYTNALTNPVMQGFTVLGSIEPYVADADSAVGRYAVGTDLRPFASGHFVNLTIDNAGAFTFGGEQDVAGNTTLLQHVQASGIHQDGDFALRNQINTFSAANTFQGVISVSGTVDPGPLILIHPASGTIQIWNQTELKQNETHPMIEINPSGITLTHPVHPIPSGWLPPPSGGLPIWHPTIEINPSGILMTPPKTDKSWRKAHSIIMSPSGFLSIYQVPLPPPSGITFPSGLPSLTAVTLSPSGLFLYPEGIGRQEGVLRPAVIISPSGLSITKPPLPPPSGMNFPSGVMVTHPVIEINPSGIFFNHTDEVTWPKLNGVVISPSGLMITKVPLPPPGQQPSGVAQPLTAVVLNPSGLFLHGEGPSQLLQHPTVIITPSGMSLTHPTLPPPSGWVPPSGAPITHPTIIIKPSGIFMFGQDEQQEITHPTIEITPSGGMKFYDPQQGIPTADRFVGQIRVVPSGVAGAGLGKPGAVEFRDRNNNILARFGGGAGFKAGNLGAVGTEERSLVTEAAKWPAVIWKDTFSGTDDELLRNFAWIANWANFGEFTLQASPAASGDAFQSTSSRVITIGNRSNSAVDPLPFHNVGIGGFDTAVGTYPSNRLHVRGSVGFQASGIITSNHTADEYEAVILCSGAITVTLPERNTAWDRIYWIKQLAANALLTITPTDGSIESSGDYTGVSQQNACAQIICDGTNWHVIGGHRLQ